ncbi:hypothetical protein ANAPC5_01429 [Anaplasma phagocytophilum]|nr:hypothetical protein ANAPC5_01429 [Anaplasma phagocytophilum]
MQSALLLKIVPYCIISIDFTDRRVDTVYNNKHPYKERGREVTLLIGALLKVASRDGLIDAHIKLLPRGKFFLKFHRMTLPDWPISARHFWRGAVNPRRWFA